MGILNQLRYSFTMQRIHKEVNKKGDRILDLINNGGSEEDLTNAIANLTKPNEFNEVNGALASLVPIWFSEKSTSRDNEKDYGFSFEELFLDAGNNNVDFFGNRFMAQFIIAQTLKKMFMMKNGAALSWDTIHKLVGFDEEYRDYGWGVVAGNYLILHEAERRYGAGGCTKKVYDTICAELKDDENDELDNYWNSLTDEQCAYYQCLQEV